MNHMIWLGITSFLFAILLTPICRDVFRSFNVVDRPDKERKVHPHPIPRVGGIAIAISYMASLLLVRGDESARQQLSLVWNLVPAAGLVFAVGLIDDLLGLKPWQKLIGESIAACLAYWGGARILYMAGKPTQDWWEFPVTVIWLLACTNAFNLVDGLDGLAAGVGLFATCTTFVAALLLGNVPLALATFPLAGCLLGFLCYNFNPATIFLGDSGSLLIGFLLGCYGIIWTQKSATLMAMAAPLMALSLPLLDVALCIVRRTLRRQPIFSADRGHIHHRLLDRGFTPRRVVLLLYGICGIGAIFALLQSVVHARFSGVMIALFCAAMWIGVQYLGYSEFQTARQLLFGGEFQRILDAQLNLQNLEKALRAAVSVEECWDILREAGSKLGITSMQLHYGGETYTAGSVSAGPEDAWDMRIPLSDRDYLMLVRKFNAPLASSMRITPFADLVHNTLRPKLWSLEEPLSASSPVAEITRPQTKYASSKAD